SRHRYRSENAIVLRAGSHGVVAPMLFDDVCSVEHLRFRQAREAADYFHFYMQAGDCIESAPGWTSRPVGELFATAGITMELEGRLCILPLAGKNAPANLAGTVQADLARIMLEDKGQPGNAFALFLDIYGDYLAPFCRPLGYNGFVWDAGELLPLVEGVKPGQIVLVPDRSRLSTLYAQEYLSKNCVENAVALQKVFASPVEDLDQWRKRLDETFVLLPAKTAQQTRVALEARKAHDFVMSEMEILLTEPMRARSLTEDKTRILENLFEMRKRMREEIAS
ncbi:MAG: hypothetical protein ACOC29_01550, partial [Candidatus Sumerlaeota bacterium]